MKLPALKRIRGTLIAVPIVNIYGFLNHSRYLPDRRDLNRFFPGSEQGSLTGRLANLFLTEIVAKSTHGIDLHTGAIHRSNLPQIRANLDDPETARLAGSFGVPVLLNSNLIDGSLRESANKLGLPVLLYEAGEALRFNEISIRAGVKGVVGVMRALEMLPPSRSHTKKSMEPFVARSSTWLRAPASGLFRKTRALGSRVKRGEILGLIDDPYGGHEFEVVSTVNGIIIGCTENPLVAEGEALFHIARFETIKHVANELESFQSEHDPDDLTINYKTEEPPVI